MEKLKRTKGSIVLFDWSYNANSTWIKVSKENRNKKKGKLKMSHSFALNIHWHPPLSMHSFYYCTSKWSTYEKDVRKYCTFELKTNIYETENRVQFKSDSTSLKKLTNVNATQTTYYCFFFLYSHSPIRNVFCQSHGLRTME